MKEHQVRRLPVTDFEGCLVGILSLNDIAREAARKRPQSPREVTDAGVSETLAAIGEPQHVGASPTRR